MTISNELMDSEVAELTGFLKALAGETRQRVLFAFLQGDELTVNQVAERLSIGQSTASESLAALKHTGILRSTRHGKSVFYRPDRDRALSLVDKLRTYLETCCPVCGASESSSTSTDGLATRTKGETHGRQEQSS